MTALAYLGSYFGGGRRFAAIGMELLDRESLAPIRRLSPHLSHLRRYTLRGRLRNACCLTARRVA